MIHRYNLSLKIPVIGNYEEKNNITKIQLKTFRGMHTIFEALKNSTGA